MACEIALEEMNVARESILLDWDNNDANLQELNRLNPLGAAPVAVIDRGTAVTQNIAIMEYFSDKNPQSKMLPPPGTVERAVAMQWLSFAATDFHKSFQPLFALDYISKNETTRTEVRNWAVAGVNENLAYLDQALAGKDFITGSTFTAADCYLFVVANWTKWQQIDLSSYKNLSAYLARVYQRPAVQTVLKKSNLLQ